MEPDSSTGFENPDAQDHQVDATDVADAEQIQGDQDANSEAASSTAKDVTEVTLEDTIRAAMEQSSGDDDGPESSDGKREQESEQTDADKAKGEKGEAGEADDPDNPDAKEAKDDADVPFHKHPRWQEKLRKERELTQQVTTFKEGHERFQQIERFMETNQLAAEEVAQGFQIMALMRTDPDKALEVLQPYVRDLEIATGRQLPDDLKQRVDDGVTDEDTAREAARLRMENQRRQRDADQARQHGQNLQQQHAVQAIQSAADAVEQEIRGSDPDYARKSPFIMDRVRSLIVAERPQNPEQAAAIVRKAHTEVTEALKSVAGQRKAVTPVRSGDAVTSGRPAPKSLLDAVTAAANAT